MEGETEEKVFRDHLYHFCITMTLYGFQHEPLKLFVLYSELGGSRTHDPRLKRALLYQLSYELVQDYFYKVIT